MLSCDRSTRAAVDGEYQKEHTFGQLELARANFVRTLQVFALFYNGGLFLKKKKGISISISK